jgi:chorismate--pyruvate lyase
LSIRWFSVNKLKLGFIPKPLFTCLQEKGSFTQHIKKYCNGELQLELESQTWKKPLLHESKELNLRNGEHALVREIYFKCDNIPWVYARSIIPRKTLRGAQRRLVYLGTRSLGSYLFSKQTAFRGKIEIATIPNHDKLYSLALKNKAESPKQLWGRRSIFYIKEKPLLVIEIFLPDGIKCINTVNN